MPAVIPNPSQLPQSGSHVEARRWWLRAALFCTALVIAASVFHLTATFQSGHTFSVSSGCFALQWMQPGSIGWFKAQSLRVIMNTSQPISIQLNPHFPALIGSWDGIPPSHPSASWSVIAPLWPIPALFALMALRNKAMSVGWIATISDPRPIRWLTRAFLIGFATSLALLPASAWFRLAIYTFDPSNFTTTSIQSGNIHVSTNPTTKPESLSNAITRLSTAPSLSWNRPRPIPLWDSFGSTSTPTPTIIPLWFVALLTATLAHLTNRLARPVARWNQEALTCIAARRSPTCHHCFYDRSGLEQTAPCPECGAIQSGFPNNREP